jgi:glucose/arabinose dehydrogenase
MKPVSPPFQGLPALSLIAAALLIGCGSSSQTQAQNESSAVTGECTPVDTNARETSYKPAFEGQTRVCKTASNVAFSTTIITKSLDYPWAVEPLPNGDLLVNEKTGQMRIVTQAGKIGPAIKGVPKVDSRGQGGLLDVALSPDFNTDRTVYWSYTEPRSGGNGTSVAKGVLSRDGTSLDDVKVILQVKPTYDNNMHYGSRLAFGPDGMLYVTTGERSDLKTRPQAQHLDSHFGKVLRVTPDGKPAEGNPFVGQANALPEIWSYGHRNIQASAFDAEGRFWDIEHGPRGGDELNLVEKGKNYGWPLASYGIEYSGDVIKTNNPHREGYEQPVYYWDPVIGPSGAQFYTGDAFPEWKNSLFIGSLRQQRLVRLELENNRVVREEHLLTDHGQRIRDVRQGPDGALYLVSDGGQLIRLAPK